MQTFLPYPSFRQSARVLDRQRLGKQRLEAYQLLRGLIGETTGWTRHPASKMWKDHECSLCDYAIIVCREWQDRGYQDSILKKLYKIRLDLGIAVDPLWLGDERLHRSHRSNLLRKDAIYYGQFGWTETSDIPYYWPLP